MGLSNLLIPSSFRYTPQRSHHINPLRLLAASALPLLCLSTTLYPTSAYAQDDDDPTSSTAQITGPFIDPLTSLPMERFFGARTQFSLSLALPLTSTLSTSFIAQLSFPLVSGTGWGALGFTGNMEGNFIIAAWPDGLGGVMASFRQASNEDNPPEVQGRFQIRPIAEGVSVSDTQLTYTFLCEECLNSTLGLGPEATVGNTVMGWALSERGPRGDASDPGARLGFHERGFGPYTQRLAEARTELFESVAVRAGAPVRNSGRAQEAQVNIFEEGGESGDESGGEDSDDEDEGEDGGVVAGDAAVRGGAAAAGSAAAGGGVIGGAAAEGAAAGAAGTATGTGRNGAGAGRENGNIGDDSDSDDDD
jgi:hypothetical protein